MQFNNKSPNSVSYLEVSELQRRRGVRYHFGGLSQGPTRLLFSLGGNHLQETWGRNQYNWQRFTQPGEKNLGAAHTAEEIECGERDWGQKWKGNAALSLAL